MASKLTLENISIEKKDLIKAIERVYEDELEEIIQVTSIYPYKGLGGAFVYSFIWLNTSEKEQRKGRIVVSIKADSYGNLVTEYTDLDLEDL